MRYIKKLALYSKSPMDDRLSVLQDNRIVTTSKTTLEVPTGAKTDRPSTIVDGTVRYNTTLNEFEVYNSMGGLNSNPLNTNWEIIRTIRQATITPQNLGYGNYNDYIFGPLAYKVDTTKPQNVLVFVDNVYQIPVTNYTLVTNSNAFATTTLSTPAPASTNTLYVSTLTNIDVGEPGVWRTITAPSGISVGTTVTSISLNFSPPNRGYPVGISIPTSGSLNSGTTITVNYADGVYVQFTGPVPAKPVFTLLGFDGYFPAGPNRTLFES